MFGQVTGVRKVTLANFVEQSLPGDQETTITAIITAIESIESAPRMGSQEIERVPSTQHHAMPCHVTWRGVT